MLGLLRDFVPRPLTGALPLDPAGDSLPQTPCSLKNLWPSLDPNFGSLAPPLLTGDF